MVDMHAIVQRLRGCRIHTRQVQHHAFPSFAPVMFGNAHLKCHDSSFTLETAAHKLCVVGRCRMVYDDGCDAHWLLCMVMCFEVHSQRFHSSA